jgi:hypothetical protein
MLFFQLVNDGGRADLQDTCGIPDATAIETHINHLLFDRREAPLVRRIEQKGTMRTVGILAAIALLLGVGLAAFDHVIALTIGTSYRNEYHRVPLSRDRLSMAYIPVKVQI